MNRVFKWAQSKRYFVFPSDERGGGNVCGLGTIVNSIIQKFIAWKPFLSQRMAKCLHLLNFLCFLSLFQQKTNVKRQIRDIFFGKLGKRQRPHFQNCVRNPAISRKSGEIEPKCPFQNIFGTQCVPTKDHLTLKW